MKSIRSLFAATLGICTLAMIPNFAQAQGTVLQTGTWVHSASMTTNTTLTLAENQLMEVLSVSLDNSSGSIDITTTDTTMTLGIGGNPNVPYPLVISGPAVVTLKKESTGGQGNMLTYRLVDAGVPTGPRVTKLNR
jgi:hypothetical protein